MIFEIGPGDAAVGGGPAVVAVQVADAAEEVLTARDHLDGWGGIQWIFEK